MAASTDDNLDRQINKKSSKLEFCGVRLFAISDYLCSDEFKILQEQIFRNFEELQQREAQKLAAASSSDQMDEIEEPTFNLNELNPNNENYASNLFTESDNKYICKICGKELKKSNSIEDHIRTHTGEKPYKCKDCNKCFSQAVSLNLHMRVHASQNHNNTCNVCLIKFENSAKLIDHMHIHSALKRYPCAICNKNFSSSSKLRRHLPTHTGEKRYTCSMCDKRFTQSSSLNKHFKNTHAIEGTDVQVQE